MPADAATPRATNVIVHGQLVLNLDGFSVSVGGQDVPLTLSEFLLLTEFVRRPNMVLERTTLAAAVKAYGYANTVSPLSNRSIDLHISRLRRKLRDAGYDCIRTMRYVGYRFVPSP